MNITEEKKVLRKAIMELRKALNQEEKEQYDQWISEQLWLKLETLKAEVVHAYLSMGTEINITPFLEKALAAKKTVICPKTLPKRQLEHLQLQALNQVEEGRWGTTHPASGTLYQGPIDLIIVPGLAFDSENYRLGYGGGYYDNFLANYPKAYKLAVAYPFQIVRKVPKELHDFQLDAVLYQSV
jgi:5-formyltetrahydrofolate cyclo-ligase